MSPLTRATCRPSSMLRCSPNISSPWAQRERRGYGYRCWLSSLVLGKTIGLGCHGVHGAPAGHMKS